MSSFIDSVSITVVGGNGGAGVASFEKRRGKPRGKPNGGSGGPGGDVLLRADDSVASLIRYERQPHWRAGDGTHGEGELRLGRAGDTATLPVPLGTLVRDEDGTLLADLVEEGQRITVARGGKGGRGNASFVSRSRRAPGFAEQGEYGEQRNLRLELKLLADAALVGFPNAGKSTLISRVSSARPKIAEYPFTTLVPHLGVVSVGDREFVLADIPGLIEGAAEGRGLGHEFLRHTERARVMVILLDPTPIQEMGPSDQLRILRSELHRHSPELAARPQIVVLNKVDTLDADEELPSVTDNGTVLLPVSAVTGVGVSELVHAVADRVDESVRLAPDREGYELHRPLPTGFEVARDGDEWVITGTSALRAANLDDLTVPEAADFVAKRLARIGVDDALSAAGAVPGDDVRIGDLVFTYEPEAVEDDGS
jgi:GTP-binding protein